MVPRLAFAVLSRYGLGLNWPRVKAAALLRVVLLGFAWLPIAMLLQTLRDASFLVSGEWALGRAPIHALGIGFFGSMLIAMVTRVTQGHSGRPLMMDRTSLLCFGAVQGAAVARVGSEITSSPAAIQWLLIGSVALWLAACALWSLRNGPIYLAPRLDGKPG